MFQIPASWERSRSLALLQRFKYYIISKVKTGLAHVIVTHLFYDQWVCIYAEWYACCCTRPCRHLIILHASVKRKNWGKVSTSSRLTDATFTHSNSWTGLFHFLAKRNYSSTTSIHIKHLIKLLETCLCSFKIHLRGPSPERPGIITLLLFLNHFTG